MIRSHARVGALLGALLGLSIGLAAPSAAQDVPVADRLLWPSWSQSLAELGLGREPAPLVLWAAPERARPRGICQAAGGLGATAGLVAEIVRSEPVDWPAGFDYFPARSWRSLPKLGAAFGKALVCPPPLTRAPSVVPTSPEL